MSDSIKKLLQIMSETTASGSVASVASPIGKSPLKRSSDTIFAAESVPQDADTGLEDSPPVDSPANFGLWKNSAVIGREQYGKHGRKKMKTDKTQIYPQLKEGADTTEQRIDELSNKTLGAYKKAAGLAATAADTSGDFKRGDKRFSGIVKATRKEFDNDKKSADKKTESAHQCSECGGPAYSNEMIAEEKDACYNKVKSRYKVWPSAYASGALVKCRKVGAANWGNSTKESVEQGVAEGSLNESDKFTSWYDWKDQAKSSGYTITRKDDKIVALNKQGQVVGHWSDVGKFLSGKAPRPNFKRPVEQGVAEGLGKDIKRLATGKDVKSRVGQEIAKSQDASMKGDTKTSKKHFDRYDKLDKLANKEQGVAEGLSKRDQQDVATIKSAIERLQAQLSQPGADRAAIQATIAHEKKRLALYGEQSVAEGFDSEELANEVYAEFERIYPNLARQANERTVHAAIIDVINYGGDSDPAALAQDVARAVKRNMNQGVAEGFDAEYDDEAGMAETNLHTAARAIEGLIKTIQDRDNLPEWVQEKIAKAEAMLVSSWDYLLSQKEQGRDPQIDESAIAENLQYINENLRKWFQEKWVRFGPDGKIRGDCARGSSSEGKPKCLPKSKAQSLGKKGRASSAAKKRREDPNADRSGKAKNVATKVREATKEVTEAEQLDEKGAGLWANIRAKQQRIKSGSGEKMRKPGSKGSPSNADLKSIRKASNESVEDDFENDGEWAGTGAQDQAAATAFAGSEASHASIENATSIAEAEITEEMIADRLKEELALFKKGTRSKDKSIGKRPADREVQAKTVEKKLEKKAK